MIKKYEIEILRDKINNLRKVIRIEMAKDKVDDSLVASLQWREKDYLTSLEREEKSGKCKGNA